MKKTLAIKIGISTLLMSIVIIQVDFNVKENQKFELSKKSVTKVYA